eukprot:scaffold36544_cov83-Isochrysis_galbana.AAC.1
MLLTAGRRTSRWPALPYPARGSDGPRASDEPLPSDESLGSDGPLASDESLAIDESGRPQARPPPTQLAWLSLGPGRGLCRRCMRRRERPGWCGREAGRRFRRRRTQRWTRPCDSAAKRKRLDADARFATSGNQ